MKTQRLICMLLTLGCLLPLLAACGKHVPAPDTDETPQIPEDQEQISTQPEEIDVNNTIAPYVSKYADDDAATAWLNTHIYKTDVPPITFMADGVPSDTLRWNKEYGKVQTVVDYPEEAPFTRCMQPITYTCESAALRIELSVTTYPGYPVVEYDGVLYNEADGNSCRLSELQAIDERIDTVNSAHILRAMRGSIYGATLIPGTDFAPLTYSSFDGTGVELAVTTGRPSETYIPYFNLENPECNTGTIAILNWQGSWKASFVEADDGGIRLRAGQHQTDFVLQKQETARFPGMVLLFYKGDYLNGQNVYRRWAYQCNLFREQGEHMKNTNVLTCSATTSEAGDLRDIAMYDNTGLTDLIDKYNIDAGDATHGWYPTEGKDWSYVGNWYPNEKYYPNGLLPISEAAHDADMQFALWLEPERLYGGTETAQDLKDSIIALNPDGSACLGDDIRDGQICLLNYADPKAVEYMVELLSTAFEEFGIDQYRQDYNIQPAPYWAAMDAYETEQMGISRIGLTENHACTGYLNMWSQLQEKNPGMYYDNCATGGTRYDLSSMRYSFLHTRSDEWWNIENAQNQSYGASMWFLYCGTGFTDLSNYDVRSHIGNSIGVGISNASHAAALENALEEWLHLADYMFYDYYTLTPYAGSSKRTSAVQYDSPETGMGMFITYFRKNDEIVVSPRGLDPDADYVIWDRDDPANTEKIMSGAEIMAGLTLSAKARTAMVYEYCLADGQSTEKFQAQSVPTGLGSTNFDPATLLGGKDETLFKVSVPAVEAEYSPAGMSDAQLMAAYAITGDNKISFVGYDYMSAGSIYAISKNVYDGVVRSGLVLADGWEALNKTKMEIEVAGAWYLYTQWDGMVFIQQPYVKAIGDTYFLWLTNTTGLSDTDGAWQNWKIRLRWTDAKGNKTTSAAFTIYCEGKKAQRLHFEGAAEYASDDYIYQIDEAIFSSFHYTGSGKEMEGKTWYEIDTASCGYILPAGSKAPSEKSSLATQMKAFDAEGDVRLYTACENGTYYLYFKGAADCGSGRMTLAWRTPSGECCAQTFLMN